MYKINQIQRDRRKLALSLKRMTKIKSSEKAFSPAGKGKALELLMYHLSFFIVYAFFINHEEHYKMLYMMTLKYFSFQSQKVMTLID